VRHLLVEVVEVVEVVDLKMYPGDEISSPL